MGRYGDEDDSASVMLDNISPLQSWGGGNSVGFLMERYSISRTHRIETAQWDYQPRIITIIIYRLTEKDILVYR